MKIENAAKTINIKDFGLEPDSGEDAVEKVRTAIEKCRGREGLTTLVFPKGRYDFRPEHCEVIPYYLSNTRDDSPKKCPIVFRNIKNLTIDGQGSEFIFHGRLQPLTFENCENIHVNNIDMDWEIPLVAQALIVDVRKSYIDIKINKKETPFELKDGKIEFTGEDWRDFWNGCHEFESSTRLIPQQSGGLPLGENWKDYRAEEINTDGLVRLHCDFERKPQEGNILIMSHSLRGPAGVFIYKCRNTCFEEINLYSAAGLGFLGQYSEDIRLDHCSAMPNYGKRRYQSGHADGFQVSNCRGKILVENCKFEGLMDDPINVHGTSVVIDECKTGSRLVCSFQHRSSRGLEWAREGDELGFIKRDSMATVATGKVRSFTKLDADQFILDLDTEIPAGVETGDALENLTWTPDFTVRNTWFGSCRARSLLVSTPGEVLIENNDFISSGAAIVIAGDAGNWYESGAVKDVFIRGNRFHPHCLTNKHGSGEGVISIAPVIPEIDPAKPFHRNISVIENVFDVFDYSVLYALSVDGLTFSHNIIKHNTYYQPWLGRRAMLTVEACKNVEIKGNLIADDVLGKNIEIINTAPGEVKTGSGQGIIIEDA